jgi:hypothetical protein
VIFYTLAAVTLLRAWFVGAVAALHVRLVVLAFLSHTFLLEIK